MLHFRCPTCAAVLQLREEFAGRQVRCQGCQAVCVAPAAPAPVAPPPPEIVDLIPLGPPPSAQPPAADALTSALDGGPPPPMVRLARDKEEERPARVRKTNATSSDGVPLTVALLGVGGVLLVCVLTAVGAWWYFSSRPAEPLAVAPNPPVVLLPLQPLQPPQPGPERPPFAGFKDKLERKEPPRPIVPPPPEKKPAPPPLPPVKVALKDGSFTTQVSFKEPGLEERGRLSRRYQFEGKAGTIYWVQTQDNHRLNVRIQSPDGPLAQPDDRFGTRDRTQVAFHAPRAGTYTVSLECWPFDGAACRLTIREMDGREPLPEGLRLPASHARLPRLTKSHELNVYNKAFSSAAFAPDSKSFYIAHVDGTLSIWGHPDPAQKGSFTFGRATRVSGPRLFGLGVDRRGRVYAQRGTASVPGPGSRIRKPADLDVWENLTTDRSNTPLPPPSKTLPLAGVVHRMIPSRTGDFVYFLDVHNRKLGRISAETGSIDKVIDKLSSGARSFCLTPDGKKLYVCSDSNRIDVIDAASFTLQRTVILDRGQPFDIAVNNQGVAILVGARENRSGGNNMLVDLTGVPERASVIRLSFHTISQYVCLLPDGKTGLYSGDRRVYLCSLPARPGLVRMASEEQWIRNYFVPGQIVVSPDGRTLLHESGVILSINP